MNSLKRIAEWLAALLRQLGWASLAWLALLISLIWIAGPMLAIGDTRPLEAERSALCTDRSGAARMDGGGTFGACASHGCRSRCAARLPYRATDPAADAQHRTPRRPARALRSMRAMCCGTPPSLPAGLPRRSTDSLGGTCIGCRGIWSSAAAERAKRAALCQWRT